MNRQERRMQRRETVQRAKELPAKLTSVPREEWPYQSDRTPIEVWFSKKYLVQMYDESTVDKPGLMRLSINRSTRDSKGGWSAGLTWDELYSIKQELGYGDWYGVEVYPRDVDLVNVSNMRHLWLTPYPLDIGWFAGGKR